MDGLQAFQDPDVLKSRMCFHSRTASTILEDWKSVWNVSFSSEDEMFNVSVNETTEFKIFIPKSTGTSLLAGVKDDGNRISLLYCTTPKQEVPYCTSCVRRNCYHYRKLQSFISNQESQVDEEVDEEIYHPKHDEEEKDFGFNKHYLKPLPKHVRGHLYGFNFTPIVYPFSESTDQQRVWIERLNGSVNIPDKLLPVFDPEYKCKHNNTFMESEESLIRISTDLCLINDVGERIMKSEVFARPSDGPCQCLHRFDGHSYLVWNIGQGRAVCYTLLLGYLHKWRGSGISMHALYKGILDCAHSCGVSCSVSYSEIHKSICGFFSNLQFNVKKAFSCPTHGTSPL